MNVDVQSHSGRFVGGGEDGGEGEHHEQCGHEQDGVGGSDCQIGESGGEDEGDNDDGVWHDVPPCGDDDDDNESCGDGDDGGDRDKMDGWGGDGDDGGDGAGGQESDDNDGAYGGGDGAGGSPNRLLEEKMESMSGY